MSSYCDKLLPFLKLLYVELVKLWCSAVKYCVFEPNLYMLRFPEPPVVKYHRDTLMYLIPPVNMSELYIRLFLPPSYQDTLDRLKQIQPSKLNKNTRLNRHVQAFKLRSKTTDELKLLCDKYLIYYERCNQQFKFDRDLAIKIISKYIYIIT
jgi:hypothetical protein